MFLFLLSTADTPHVYVRASKLCCFHSLISITFGRALAASMDSFVDMKSALSVAESGGRYRKARLGVWRKVPESEAWSVEEDAGKRGLACGGRYRKARLGV